MLIDYTKIKWAIVSLTIATTLIGGHVLASIILLDPSRATMIYLGYGCLAIIGLNAICFVSCLFLQLSNLPYKRKLMLTACLLLINIPIAWLYLIFLSTYET